MPSREIPILIPCPDGYDHPAVRALRQEGLDPVAVPLAGEYAYGDVLREWWQRLTGFVLVEHDVIPWPGAVAKLWSCPESWCVHEYPHGKGTLAPALGCVRFGPQLCHAHPTIPEKWLGDSWATLDGTLISAVWEALGRPWHVHGPPVAHARQRTG